MNTVDIRVYAAAAARLRLLNNLLLSLTNTHTRWLSVFLVHYYYYGGGSSWFLFSFGIQRSRVHSSQIKIEKYKHHIYIRQYHSIVHTLNITMLRGARCYRATPMVWPCNDLSILACMHALFQKHICAVRYSEICAHLSRPNKHLNVYVQH